MKDTSKTALRRGHNEGNIRQRTDGRWEVRLSAGMDYKTGKPRRTSTCCNTRQEAIAILQQQAHEVRTQGWRDPMSVTLGEWYEYWLDTYMKDTVKQSTYASYLSTDIDNINTRTTAVFFIKYLRTLGFSATNDIFAHNAWYFRNSLVRANYTNLQKGIHETTEYLELFLRNLLLGENNELHNRTMHISGYWRTEKVDIRDRIQKIEEILARKAVDFSSKTAIHTQRLFVAYGFDEVFGRSMITKQLGIKEAAVSRRITKLLQADIIEPVSGYGKGKYRFKSN